MKGSRVAALFVTILLVAGLAFGQNNSPQPLVGGVYVAQQYNYGGIGAGSGPISAGPFKITSSAIPAGSGTITVAYGSMFVNGRKFMPFAVNAPILILGSNSETVTPTAVSCSTPDITNTCNITATFANAHGAGENVASGTFGLQEAINDAFQSGGGIVVVDQAWVQAGGLPSTIAAATPYANVTVEDRSQGPVQYWTITQKASTVLAAPATLTNSTAGFSVAGANLTAGFYTGSSTYIACIAYVDVAGQEGPCSATFTIATSGSAATDQIGFTAPAASTGAVGYTIYISLAGGTYNLTYQVPLTSSVCTLTKVETVTPACAVANTTYAQSGSAAIVSALTVNTAPLHLLATTASTTSAYIGTPNGRTTYAYAPHNQVGIPGLLPSSLAFTIAPATATTVPSVIGTINVPAGFMNFPGRAIRVCGTATEASAGSTATIENLELLWDAAGSNTAGAPVIVENLTAKVTLVTSNVDYFSFCGDIQTTVSGTGVTAGSIMPVGGFLNTGSGAAGAQATGGGMDELGAAVASLNLAGTGGNSSRIHVVYNHTTGTDAAGVTLLGLTVQGI